MATYPTKLAEAFASQTLEIFYQRSVADAITNSEYEGQIRDKTSKLNVLTFGALDAQNYTGANLVADDLTESNAQLVTDQAKAFYYRVKSYDTFRSYVKNPEQTVQKQTADRLKQIIDQFIFTFWADVAAGNRLGTSYTTGTVTVDVTTGVVTGSGTTFTSAMVGKGFKAVGHTKWYRIKTFTSTTSIVIEDDKDDETSAYTGGAIAGGTAYEIQANTAVQITAANVMSKITALSTILDNAEVPQGERWLVLPASIADILKLAPEYISIGSEGGREAAMNGKMPGMFAGFEVYSVADGRMVGNTTDGFHVLGGHKSAICFAMGMTEVGMEDLIGNFGKAYKSLTVYGAKVPDERRKALVEGYFKL
jgi:hypothetical protein